MQAVRAGQAWLLLPMPGVLLTRRGLARLRRARLEEVVKLALLQAPAQRAVPVVLYGVVRAALQVLRQLGPRVAQLGVQPDQQLVLLGRPVSLLDVRVEVVVPPGAERGNGLR
jgi:pantothenate synthetase